MNARRGGGLAEHGPGLALRHARGTQRRTEVVRRTAVEGPFVVRIVLPEHHLVDANGMTGLYLRPGEDGGAEIALPGEVLTRAEGEGVADVAAQVAPPVGEVHVGEGGHDPART